MSNIKIKSILEYDIVNYYKPNMFIIFPNCTFKCEKDCGIECCQNSTLVNSKTIEIDIDKIIYKYINNPLTHAVVCGGLEPFDSFSDLLKLITKLRAVNDDDIVIYTGYNKDEISMYLKELSPFNNIVIKYGRYIPNSKTIYDSVLGVNLASDNQYAERL